MRIGRRLIAWFVVCAAIIATVWWASNDAPESTAKAVREEPEAAPAPTRGGTSQGSGPAASTPHLRLDGPVEIDRQPRRPDEIPRRYEWRKGVIDAFDELRRRTGISDEKAQAVLLVLYDYQENKSIMRGMFDEASRQGEVAWTNLDADTIELRADILQEARDRLDALLTEEELRVWWRKMEPANVWFHLSFDRYIRPLEDS